MFPFLESIHVITAAMVVGSILFVDLRLLGLAATNYSVATLAKELAPWSWAAFFFATVTGLGMFITRAASHVVNPAFQWKLVLLFLAGVNMAYFHLKIYNSVTAMEASSEAIKIKLIGGTSLFLWCGVMLAGRWVGHIV